MKSGETEDEIWFHIKSPDYAHKLLFAYGQHLRSEEWLDCGEYFTLAIDKDTFQARIVPLSEEK